MDVHVRVFGSTFQRWQRFGSTFQRTECGETLKALPRAIETGGMMASKKRWWAYAHQWPIIELSVELMKAPGPFLGEDGQPLGPEFGPAIGEYMAMAITLDEKGRGIHNLKVPLQAITATSGGLGSEWRKLQRPSQVSNYLEEYGLARDEDAKCGSTGTDVTLTKKMHTSTHILLYENVHYA